MPRKNIARVPKKLLAEKYLKLPIKQKIAKMREMRNCAHKLITSAEALEREANKTLNDFTGRDIDIQKAKTKKAELETKRKQVLQQRQELLAICEQYFVQSPLSSLHNTNPISLRIHKTDRLLQLFREWFGLFKEDIKIHEKYSKKN